MEKSAADKNTEQKLRAELTDFEQRYQTDRLEGLSVGALNSKKKQSRAEAAHIIESFPTEAGLSGPWRGFAYADSRESLAPLSHDQQMEVLYSLKRCLDNIEKVRTERKDKRREERWKRFNKTLQSVAQVIPALG